MVIAIDGPAGSGKTTIAKILAKRLNIAHLDTGAIYRTLTLKALEQGVDLSDISALKVLAQNLEVRFEGEKVYLEGRDVTQKIREPRIVKNISCIVCLPQVREVMVRLQRRVAGDRDVVIEGRDITTVVLPQAEFKFYLDADPLVRAKRRHRELSEKGVGVKLAEVKNDLEKRDAADRNREVGPLVRAPDAVYIDTTGLDIEGVVNILLRNIDKKG